MQLVERGLIQLDDDVSQYIPELADQPIFEGFSTRGEPILKPHLNNLTFKHLLTHSAGALYSSMNPDLQKYIEANGLQSDPATVAGNFSYPLVYEPGTSWNYSTSIDWAGLVIERITGINLETHMKQSIFSPLGIISISFFPSPSTIPSYTSRRAGMTTRDPATGKLHPSAGAFSDKAEHCFGGHGAFLDVTDYAKVLESLMKNDERILSKASVEEMFRPQLTARSKEALNKAIRVPEKVLQYVGDLPAEVEYDWGIGGILTCTDEVEGERRRRKGTLIWSGMPNLYWVNEALIPFHSV